MNGNIPRCKSSHSIHTANKTVVRFSRKPCYKIGIYTFEPNRVGCFISAQKFFRRMRPAYRFKNIIVCSLRIYTDPRYPSFFRCNKFFRNYSIGTACLKRKLPCIRKIYIFVYTSEKLFNLRRIQYRRCTASDIYCRRFLSYFRQRSAQPFYIGTNPFNIFRNQRKQSLCRIRNKRAIRTSCGAERY